MPRKNTVDTTMASTVAKVVSGTVVIFSVVVVARFSPISATMVPMTTGGINAWIQPVPAFCTMSPTMNRQAPAITIPPSAPPIPAWPSPR